jgi:7-cyano-7-deazaguanine reductase
LPKKTPPADLEGLTMLGRKKTGPARKLETFSNHHPGRDYTVTLRTDEFTCVCPATGQPDFARLTIQYIPRKRIVESKSLKLYLWSFRNEGSFHEHVTNAILDDLVKALAPRWCKVSADFAVRGGIAITVEAEYGKPPRGAGNNARQK